MWIARRIFLKELNLSRAQKFALLNNALTNIVFPFIDDKNYKDYLTGWYYSRKWDYSDERAQYNFSVRIYLNVKEKFNGEVENDFDKLVNHYKEIMSVQNEYVDKTLATLPFIQRACEIAKGIIQKFPEWDRRFNRHCYNEVGYEVQELRKLMHEFDSNQQNEVAHFILFNTHLLESPSGCLAQWDLNNVKNYQFATRIPSVFEHFQ